MQDHFQRNDEMKFFALDGAYDCGHWFIRTSHVIPVPVPRWVEGDGHLHHFHHHLHHSKQWHYLWAQSTSKRTILPLTMSLTFLLLGFHRYSGSLSYVVWGLAIWKRGVMLSVDWVVIGWQSPRTINRLGRQQPLPTGEVRWPDDGILSVCYFVSGFWIENWRIDWYVDWFHIMAADSTFGCRPHYNQPDFKQTSDVAE